MTGETAQLSVRPGLLLAICCSSLFMVWLDVTVVTIGLPAIARSLHTQVTGLQWTVDGYTVVLASLLLFSGSLADRLGRRALFQVGLATFTLGSWLCSVAPSLGWLLTFRLLQGMGGSMLSPCALGIITSTFTKPADRARALGVWEATIGLSMAAGPVIGGILVGSVGWRGIFWANIPVGLAATGLAALAVPESRAARSRRPDPAGQLLVIAMLAAACFAIIEGPRYGWLSPWICGCFAVAATALAGLLAYEPRRAEPLVDFRLFRARSFGGSVFCATAVNFAQGGFLFLITLYLQDVRGYTALRAGLVMVPMPAALALCSAVAGRLVARHGPRATLTAGGGAVALAGAALALTVGSATSYQGAAFALFGAGIGLANPAITNGIVSGVPQAQASVASGMNSSSRQLGILLGTAVVGSVLAASLHGPIRAGFVTAARPGWWTLAACGCAVLLVGFLVKAARARSRDHDELLAFYDYPDAVGIQRELLCGQVGLRPERQPARRAKANAALSYFVNGITRLSGVHRRDRSS